MKRILLLSTIIAATLCYSCSDTNSKIEGTVKNYEGKKIYLDHIDINQITKIDSAELGNSGEFTFKVKVETPEFYQLRLKGCENIYIMAEKDSTQTINITNPAEYEYSVEGSTLSSELKKVVSHLSNARKRLHSIYLAMADEVDQSKLETLKKSASQTILDQIQFSRKYIIENPGSPVAYFVLYQKLHDDYVLTLPTNLNYYRAVATNLDIKYPNAKYSKFVKNHVLRLIEENTNAQLNTLINTYSRDLPELKLKDSKGKEFDIEKLRGKTILLDFAMITEQGTVAYQKELGEIYKKYSGKGLVIVQVCFDKSKILWEMAVREHDIKWTCLLDENSVNSKILTDWNISTIPANYIIDKNFKIVGKNQFGENLSDYIKDLLK
ncbi:MAG: AhpC/TSA family protein [Marinifilaceae bacterium]|nr:AhpC/TSA family protein [Marinifilaceae bacterium]